jgi:MFS family permease
MLGWLMGLGGVASMIASPLVGVLSDRTRTRFGRRAPWMLGGALAAAAALVGAAFAPSYAYLLFIWMFFQMVLAFSITSGQTVPPDRVPTRQFGIISGVMGMTYTAAVVLGSVVGAMFPIKTAYLLTAAVLMICVLPFLLLDREQSSQNLEVSHKRGPLLPRWSEATDFWWVFITRLLVTLAQSIALFYLLYYLRDRVGMDTEAANQGVMILSIIYAVCVVITAIWSGRSSDRAGRRKIYVGLSSAGVAVACLVLVFAHSFNAVIIAAVILGISWGVYQAIDQALINQVLPSVDDRAKDMGLVNLAVAIPNAVAPLIAAQIVTSGLGYSGLYLVAAGLTLTGSILIIKVRGVR